ncbi:MAG: xanthine dehydrogenase family protein [Synergistaceae bacterium]|nr:xanthine dehydrogenase family protein [Synergistaceae bacterium]
MTPFQEKNEDKAPLIGSSPLRVDALEKACGEALYLDDLPLQGFWYGGAVRASIPRGKIRGFIKAPEFDWTRVTVVTADDIPGINAVAMIRDDYPALAKEIISFATQAVALIAAPDRKTLEEALRAFTVDAEEIPPLLTVEEALERKEIIWGKDNILQEYRVDSGDPSTAFAGADRIVEGTYRTGYQEHVYLETQGVIAIPGPEDSVEVLGSMQCPYYVHNALVKGLGLPAEKVRIRQTVTGGAFGGKEDYPSVLALQAALCARKSGHPVRMIFDRKEDLLCTPKRHPSVVRHRTALSSDGRILGADIDILLDGGAFTTMSKVVLSRSILHATGCYFIPNVSVRARAVATNTPPNGAFRGFGVPQSAFALERHMDKIALELGLSPSEIRRKNVLKPGDAFPYGQISSDGTSAKLVLEKVFEMSGYEEKRKSFEKSNTSSSPFKRGIGLSLCLHGGGFTGSGEESIAGKVSLRINPEIDRVDILVSSVEMGQGASTALAMIAAQTLGLKLEEVHHVPPDTAEVPDSGPTVASRTTMYVGKTIQEACLILTELIIKKAALLPEYEGKTLRLEKGVFVYGAEDTIPFFSLTRQAGGSEGFFLTQGYSPPEGFFWNEEEFRGDAYKAYGWIANVIEVEVNMDSLEISPKNAWVAAEIGRAISPVMASGQIEGGILQALGYAYLEEFLMKDGKPVTAHLNQYLIPTTLDTPKFHVHIFETPFPEGPFGAKGLGELPMDSSAPALAAAVQQAAKVFPTAIPLTGEYLSSLLPSSPPEVLS